MRTLFYFFLVSIFLIGPIQTHAQTKKRAEPRPVSKTCITNKAEFKEFLNNNWRIKSYYAGQMTSYAKSKGWAAQFGWASNEITPELIDWFIDKSLIVDGADLQDYEVQNSRLKSDGTIEYIPAGKPIIGRKYFVFSDNSPSGENVIWAKLDCVNPQLVYSYPSLQSTPPPVAAAMPDLDQAAPMVASPPSLGLVDSRSDSLADIQRRLDSLNRAFMNLQLTNNNLQSNPEPQKKGFFKTTGGKIFAGAIIAAAGYGIYKLVTIPRVTNITNVTNNNGNGNGGGGNGDGDGGPIEPPN